MEFVVYFTYIWKYKFVARVADHHRKCLHIYNFFTILRLLEHLKYYRYELKQTLSCDTFAVFAM